MEQPKAVKTPKMDKWEIEQCVDTIIRAEEIKADPKKMALVKPALEKRVAGTKRAIESIADLKAVRQEKAMEDMEMENESEEMEEPEEDDTEEA